MDEGEAMMAVLAVGVLVAPIKVALLAALAVIVVYAVLERKEKFRSP